MFNKNNLKFVLIIFNRDELNKILLDYVLTYRVKINLQLKKINEWCKYFQYCKKWRELLKGKI